MDANSHLNADIDRLPLVSLIPPETQYCCPGETHSINRAVHLSRLAAFYPACRQCPHRHDTGQITPQTVERIQQVERRVVRPTVFLNDGVRGVFLNEFTPRLARDIVSSFAGLLWDDFPLNGRARGRTREPARRSPSIVVGYDERPSSPAILASVLESLRLMSCTIIDIGLVSRPCFAFAVDHLQAAGGVMVTGAGFESAWSGLDLLAAGALPLSLGSGLEQVEERMRSGATRPTRSAGYQRSFQATVPYEAGLWKHFHALRPLRVVCAARPRPVRKTLRQIFSKLPCALIEVEVSESVNVPLRRDVLLERACRKVEQKNAHLGVVIDDDGGWCRFINERGEPVALQSLAALLGGVVQNEHPQSPVVVVQAEMASAERFARASLVDGGVTMGSLCAAMNVSAARFGVGLDHHYWFRESVPACDAIVTLARVLQGLSRSDAAFSVVASVLD